MTYRARALMLLAGVFTALLLGVAAPAAAQSNVSPELFSSTQYCQFQLLDGAQWSGGYAVNAKVQNISDVPVVMSISVPIQPPGYIVQIWGVSLVTTTASTAVLRPWQPTLQPGEAVYFGYSGTGQYSTPSVSCQPAS